MDEAAEEMLVTDPRTGKTTGQARTVRRVLRAMSASDLPYSVIGATALAARGLPRMTRDLDLAVLLDDGHEAIRALRAAGLRTETPVGSRSDPEPMPQPTVVLQDPPTGVEVDLLIAAGDPEATVIEASPRAEVFGVMAPVASLEHLLLLYLYSNQPKHLGDFAAIVRSGHADVAGTATTLEVMHPEMLADFHQRVKQARAPSPPPPRPPPRARRRQAPVTGEAPPTVGAVGRRSGRSSRGSVARPLALTP